MGAGEAWRSNMTANPQPVWIRSVAACRRTSRGDTRELHANPHFGDGHHIMPSRDRVITRITALAHTAEFPSDGPRGSLSKETTNMTSTMKITNHIEQPTIETPSTDAYRAPRLVRLGTAVDLVQGSIGLYGDDPSAPYRGRHG